MVSIGVAKAMDETIDDNDPGVVLKSLVKKAIYLCQPLSKKDPQYFSSGPRSHRKWVLRNSILNEISVEVKYGCLEEIYKAIGTSRSKDIYTDKYRGNLIAIGAKLLRYIPESKHKDEEIQQIIQGFLMNIYSKTENFWDCGVCAETVVDIWAPHCLRKARNTQLDKQLRLGFASLYGMCAAHHSPGRQEDFKGFTEKLCHEICPEMYPLDKKTPPSLEKEEFPSIQSSKRETHVEARPVAKDSIIKPKPFLAISSKRPLESDKVPSKLPLRAIPAKQPVESEVILPKPALEQDVSLSPLFLAVGANTDILPLEEGKTIKSPLEEEESSVLSIEDQEAQSESSCSREDRAEPNAEGFYAAIMTKRNEILPEHKESDRGDPKDNRREDTLSFFEDDTTLSLDDSPFRSATEEDEDSTVQIGQPPVFELEDHDTTEGAGILPAERDSDSDTEERFNNAAIQADQNMFSHLLLTVGTYVFDLFNGAW
jgi:hypothetical protein